MKWQAVTLQRAILDSGVAYNLFRRRLTPDLCCAVPEDRPVPVFLEGSIWEYAGTLHRDDQPPSGLDLSAAELGMYLNGFHLFQTTRPSSQGSRCAQGMQCFSPSPSLLASQQN